jgi:putative transposase
MATDHRRAEAELVQGPMLDDPSFLKEIVQRVVQELLEAEMTEYIGAAPYERNATRTSQRNGHKPRTLRTRVRTLNLFFPQDREGTFCTRIFASYQRNEKALVVALMEMYVEGVSTRKVKDITEELCALPSPRAWSHAWPGNSTRSSSDGVIVHFTRRLTPTSSWTLATRRREWTIG